MRFTSGQRRKAALTFQLTCCLSAAMASLAVQAAPSAAAPAVSRPSTMSWNEPTVRVAAVAAATPAPRPYPYPECVNPTHQMSHDDVVHCWAPLFNQYSDWDHDVAGWVIWCESRGDAGVVNPWGYAGLFQLSNGPTDPAANVRSAHDDYFAHSGWAPWAQSESCWGSR